MNRYSYKPAFGPPVVVRAKTKTRALYRIMQKGYVAAHWQVKKIGKLVWRARK